MSEIVVHYYNVVLGRCTCGAEAHLEEKNFSVFPEQVTCPECLAALHGKSGGN